MNKNQMKGHPYQTLRSKSMSARIAGKKLQGKNDKCCLYVIKKKYLNSFNLLILHYWKTHANHRYQNWIIYVKKFYVLRIFFHCCVKGRRHVNNAKYRREYQNNDYSIANRIYSCIYRNLSRCFLMIMLFWRHRQLLTESLI